MCHVLCQVVVVVVDCGHKAWAGPVLGSRFYVLYLGPARGKKKIVDEGPINGQQPTKMKGEAKVSGVAAHLHHKNYT